MLFTRPVQWMLVSLGGFAVFISLAIISALTESFIDRILWLIFIAWVGLMYWRGTPYKDYEHKMQRISLDPEKDNKIYVSAGINSILSITCKGLDKTRGLLLSISQLGILSNTKQHLGDRYFSAGPSCTPNWGQPGSLRFTSINQNELSAASYLEQIKPGGCGINLLFITKEGTAFLEIITRKPSLLRDILCLRKWKGGIPV